MATFYKNINGLTWKTTIPNDRLVNVFIGINGNGCVEYINENGDGCDTSFDSVTGYNRKPTEAVRKHMSIVTELKQAIAEKEA